METYVYSYHSDSLKEPIGRVQATSLFEARKKISIQKQIDIDSIDELFKIKKLNDNGKQNRKNLR